MNHRTDTTAASPVEAEDLYKWILEDHPVGFFLLSHEQKILRTNATFAKMLGFNPGEMMGMSIADIIPKLELEANLDLTRKLHNGEINDITLEGSYLAKHGAEVPSRSSIKAVFDDAGNLNFCLATVINTENEIRRNSDLKQSQDLWKTIYQNSPFGIAIIDAKKRRFIEVNESLTQTLGYSRAEMLLISPADISPRYQPNGESSTELAIKYIGEADKGQNHFFEWHHIHKNGDDRFFRVSLNRIYLGDERLVLALTNDITSHKAQEKVLIESEDRFRNLYHTNPLMLFTVDLDYKVLAVNQSAVEQLGYSEKEFVGSDVRRVFHPEDRGLLEQNILNFLQGEHAEAAWELRKLKKSGEIIWVREIVKYIDWPDSRSLLISCENITDRINAEEIRKHTESRYRSIFENNLFGIAITPINGNFEIVNPAFCQMLGYSAEELSALTFIDITDPSDREKSKAVSEKMRREKGQFVMEKSYLKKDGLSFEARTFARLLSDNDCTEKALVIIEDISDEKKVLEQQKELSVKNDELKYKNRELTSYTLFLTQKTELLKQISSSLEEIIRDPDKKNLSFRLNKLNSYIGQNIDRDRTWREFHIHFKEVNPNFLENLTNQCPQLTQNELKHCAYVVMNLTNTDVASLLHVTPKAIEVARYRIKKKLGLADREDKLSQYLFKFL